MKWSFYALTAISIFGIGLVSCEMIIPREPAADELLDGPVEGLNEAENARFLAGDVAFNDEVFTIESGLGPLFVATSCGSCHPGDGKGHPFTTLTRFGQVDDTGNPYIGKGGPQLQNRAIPGYLPEQLPPGVPYAALTPPAITGLGYLAALTDEQILGYADPLDTDGDGISGVPNYITPPDYFQPGWFHQSFNGKYIGRFGKKGAAVDLLHQTVNAYNQDIGIVSTFNPVDPFSHQQNDPEISDKTIHDVVFYLRTLKAPIQRKQNDGEVLSGKTLFSTIGCAKCHTPEWTTPASDISSLSNKTFYPYTDLLLHNMGKGLDDGYTEGTAATSEWRTPPLWGLGLSIYSQGGAYYLMHDGRTQSIEEAILLHGSEGSEALGSTENFMSLSPADKKSLLKFLESL